MIWTNIKRVARAGFINFWRNGFVSLTSILIMVITLSVITSMIFLLATLGSSLDDLKNKVDVNVYFLTTAAESDILSLQKSLLALPGVAAVQYVSATDTLANFEARHANDQLTLQALSELPGNPLGAVLNVRASDPSLYASIADFLKSDNALSKDHQVIIDKVNYYDNKTAIDNLTRLIHSAERFGVILTFVLAALSIMISFNTIRLAIYTARDEISVMRLVGASNKYIRGPFVVSGIIYGIVAGVITLALFYPITYWIGSAAGSFFGAINVFRYYVENFSQIFLVVMGSGVLLGGASSYLAVRRYLTL